MSEAYIGAVSAEGGAPLSRFAACGSCTLDVEATVSMGCHRRERSRASCGVLGTQRSAVLTLKIAAAHAPRWFIETRKESMNLSGH